MILIENDKYLEDIHYIASLPVSWDRLKDSSILISGASGLIGSCLIDTLMEKNRTDGLNCRVCAVARNADRLRHRFGNWLDNRCFSYICQDVNEDVISISDDFDNVVHLASNTHPVAYASEPISTIMTNITGTRNLLEFA
nr:NAD-dependent epimerase/dehydratase family protein [Lachnospiraceae bacterium]